MKDTRAQLKELLADRIIVLDGSWGVLDRGGTQGSPACPLLFLHDSQPQANLPPGKARLRRCNRRVRENA